MRLRKSIAKLHWRGFIAIALLFLVILSSTTPMSLISAADSSSIPKSTSYTTAIASNSTSSPIGIDTSLFVSTVPSYITIGQNYTVKILVSNNLPQQVPIILQLVAPVAALYIHPLIVHTVALPNQSVIANFTIVSFNKSYQGPINVSAMLWVWLPSSGGPQLAQEVSALIYGVNLYPYSQFIIVFGVLGILAVVGFSIYFWTRYSRQDARTEAQTSRSPVVPRRDLLGSA